MIAPGPVMTEVTRSNSVARAVQREIPRSSHRPQERADLALFAEALAARLPGSWAAATREHADYSDQFPLRERLWGFGHARWALSEFVLQRDAMLTSDSGAELVVVDRPLRRREFLVAALAPQGINVTDAVTAPDGIVVSADPARAASVVADRLLPRYGRAVHQARIDHLAESVAAGERALAEWDSVSDRLCDADHWPLDDRYGLRQQQRDAERWAQFAPPSSTTVPPFSPTPSTPSRSWIPPIVRPDTGRTDCAFCAKPWTKAHKSKRTSRPSPMTWCPTTRVPRRSSTARSSSVMPRVGTVP